MTKTPSAPVLSRRALNRATLDRQLLLRRVRMSAADALTHLVGLQAQNVRPPYAALAARLDGFVPEELSGLMSDRAAVRAVTMRSTVHTLTADDLLLLRPLTQAALDRELRSFRGGLGGVDLDRLAAVARAYVEDEPRTPAQLRAELARHWPQADAQSLGIAARALLPLVQVTPRGLWRRSGRVALTTAEHWLGRPLVEGAAPDAVVPRYLAAFGPASVRDMQAWMGLTRLRDAFERLRPGLRTFRDENGVELFDLPDAPRPDPDTPAPPRFLPEYDNVLLSHADRSRVDPAGYKARTVKVNQPFRAFLVDGVLAGVWRLDEGGAGGGPVTVVVEPFGALTKAQRADVEDEAARTARVLAEGASSYDVRFGAVVDG
ncbi:winged helix DNA-binding domain-containing protein [Streptomyces sp. AN091965]|uniref:winged helix DNA-binding domain-containing protein n=1 Tax=Streptomyces sp. AN091965 TaxID=2927803 RepID=UPI001F61F7F6|nr:winged helix DNA-binding domain-containing protein [Streptomyces sp. AN091965]MCI3933818.1 winged helix DNA-binding domain-containing protein [Streptomyces sp. AN091965]